MGLPNVGKSTLFNAMTRTQAAEAANYPFCTIEPNVAKVSAFDCRLKGVAEIAKSEKIIHHQLEILDIAGLVKGASSGEGLGNKFLANIREVDVIIHMLRCFEDTSITHVNNTIDPVEDAKTVEMELIFADIESIEKRLKKEKTDKELVAKLQKILKVLQSGKMAKTADFLKEEDIKSLQLLTTKPVLYVCNVEDKSAATGNKFSNQVEQFAKQNGCDSLFVSAAVEQEIAMLQTQEEREEFLKELGIEMRGVMQIVLQGAKLLNLITFFTAGPKEARAWSIPNGYLAPQAAGTIHTDFEKKFIKAEVISFEDYMHYKGEKQCKDAGKLRLEGKEYIVKDGDVMHFKHGQ